MSELLGEPGLVIRLLLLIPNHDVDLDPGAAGCPGCGVPGIRGVDLADDQDVDVVGSGTRLADPSHSPGPEDVHPRVEGSELLPDDGGDSVHHRHEIPQRSEHWRVGGGGHEPSATLLDGPHQSGRLESSLSGQSQRAQRADIARAQAQVRRELRGTAHQIVHEYDGIPFLAGRLSAEAIERLRESDVVASVDEAVEALPLQSDETLPQEVDPDQEATRALADSTAVIGSDVADRTGGPGRRPRSPSSTPGSRPATSSSAAG